MTDLSSWVILGLPIHPLIVHATVVIIPLTTLLLVLAAFSARLRARAGAVLPLAGIVSFVLVPLSLSSGDSLEADLPHRAAIEAHARAADGLLPWAILLAAATILVWLTGVGRNPLKGGKPRRAINPVSVVVAVIAVVAAIGTTTQVVHIGHLGAQAAWAGIATQATGSSG